METWEFFLQKIGEERWLQLDATQPELPTGRYTIAARGQHCPHEVIEAEVSTRQTPEAIARERQCQQFCQLDEQGFSILVPEIELTPGIWEIQCRADLLDALLGQDWAITLSLRVTLDLESASLDFPTSLATKANTEEEFSSEEDLEELRSRLMADADRMLEDVVTDLFPSFQSLPEDNSEYASPAYSVALDQDQLTANLNKPIIISGQVIAHQAAPHPQLRLIITLRDPQTGDVIAKLSPRLPDSPFPLTFCYSLTISAGCNSYLLEGEVTLSDDSLQADSPVFSHQLFTVTAQWKKLQSLLTVTSQTTSHSPAPLLPLSVESSWLTRAFQKSQGIFPPRLSSTPSYRKKKTPPTLPIIPRKPPQPPPQEYMWSKPEASSGSEWELIPELVIISTDETQS